MTEDIDRLHRLHRQNIGTGRHLRRITGTRQESIKIKEKINMKCKTLAVLAAAGVLGISGAAFAGVDASIKVDDMPKLAAKTQSKPQLPPKMENMPPMSRDNRMSPSPGAHSRDKRPQEFRK